jgi:AcrR family transcriptional regulator
MEGRKSSRRVERTRQRLLESLLALIVERGYEKVTVQDILDRAESGRATFYEHFRSKEDLLRSGMERMRALLLKEWKSDAEAGAKSSEQLGFTLALFKHVDGHRHLYRAIVGRESGMIVERKLRLILADFVREDLKSRKAWRQHPVSRDFAVQYVVGALWTVMTWWLDYRVPLSAEEINGLFLQFTLPGLDAALGVSCARE